MPGCCPRNALAPLRNPGAHADTCGWRHRYALFGLGAKRPPGLGGGQFNYWDGRRHPMRLRKESGIWELFIPGALNGQLYKFELIDAHGNLRVKADPYAFESQMRPEARRLSAICRQSRTAGGAQSREPV